MSLYSLNVIPANAVTDGDYDCLDEGTPTGTFTIEFNEVKRSTNDCAGTVNIPNGVEKIAAFAFYEHVHITSVTIPNTVTEIGNGAFENTRLVSLTIPDSVRTLGTGVFQSITTLTSVTIGNGLTTIPENTFYLTGLTSVTIPNTVRIIGDNAFKETKITSLDLGEGVEQIGSYSFGGINDGVNHLDVVIPDSVTTLTGNAFGQSNLGHVVIGDGLVTIEDAVFYNNYGQGARSIVFGSNITRIKAAAFLGINASIIILPEGLQHLESRAFEQTNLDFVYLPQSLISIINNPDDDVRLQQDTFDNSTVSKAIYCGTDPDIADFDYPGSTISTCEKIAVFNSNVYVQREDYQSSASEGTLNANMFLRDGYTFSHWNTQKNGS